MSRMIDQHFPEDALLVGGGGIASDGWHAIEELGLALALVPEEAGGFGVEPAAALGTIRLAGARAVPAPLAETMVANALLASAGLPPAAGSVALAQTPSDGPPRLERTGEGWRLRSVIECVPWGSAAQSVVLEADRDGEPVLVHVGRDELELEREGANLAGHPRDTLRFDLVLDPSAVAALPGGSGALLRTGAAIRTLQIAGAAQTVLDLTVAYVSEREQFGRTLSKFQAIQQELARLAGHVAAINGAAGICAEYLEGEPGPSIELAGARARACEGAGVVAAIAHQVHGAIGFSHEYRLHLYTKLLWSWREDYLGETYWSGTVADAVIEAGADKLWHLVTGSV